MARHTQASRTPRVSGLDIGRILAIVLVVAQHLAGPLAQARGTTSTSVWLLGLAVQCVARFSVPLFIMISGALMLRPSDESVSEFYTRRFHRVAVPAVLWILIYYVLTYTYLGRTFRTPEVVIGLLRGLPYNHLYFIYAILGLYVLTPLLRAVIRSLTPSQFDWFVGLAVVGVSLDMTIRVAVGLPWTHSALTWSIAFLGYYLLGYRLLGQRVSNREARLAVGLWLAGAAASLGLLVVISGTVVERFSALLANVFSPLVVLMAASAFLLLPRLESWVSTHFRPLGRALPALASLTFGVYLLHEVFVAVLYKQYGMTAASQAPALWLAGTTIGVSALSFLLVWMLSLSRMTSWIFGVDVRKRLRTSEPAAGALEEPLANEPMAPDSGAADSSAPRSAAIRRPYAVVAAICFMLVPVAVIAVASYRENSLPQAKVVRFEQGSTSLGVPVPPLQSRPEAAVDKYDDSDEPSDSPGFCTLGLRGELILEMVGGVANGPGADLSIHEKTWGGPPIAEAAHVYVSDDMKRWRYLGVADNSGATETSPTTESRFDLGPRGVSSARYVRLVDATTPSGDENTNGFDVSLVTALHPAAAQGSEGSR